MVSAQPKLLPSSSLSSHNAPPQTTPPWSSHCSLQAEGLSPDPTEDVVLSQHPLGASRALSLSPFPSSHPGPLAGQVGATKLRHSPDVHQGPPHSCLSSLQELGILINLVPPSPPISPKTTFGFKAPEQHSQLPKEPIFAATVI